MAVKFTNNATGTLASSITASTTTITLTTGQGALFPSLASGEYFYATLVDSSNNIEIVKVTARAVDVMTVVRAQDDTTARAYAAADRFELRATAAGLNAILSDAKAYTDVTQAALTAHIADTTDAHLASAIGNTPAGTVSATTVQAAINELDTEKVPNTRTISTSAALTGGGDLSANRTLDLAATGVTANTYGSATKIPVIAVNDKGQITTASEATIVPFAWNVVSVNTSTTNYSIPANTILVLGTAYHYMGGNNGSRMSVNIKNSSGATLYTYDLTGGNEGPGGDGGSGMSSRSSWSIAIPAAAAGGSLEFFRSSGSGSWDNVVNQIVKSV